MPQKPYNALSTNPSPVEIVLHYEQFDLLPELQRLFPDIVLMCVTDRGNGYRVSFASDSQEMVQRRFLSDHTIQYVEREREREDILRAFFRSVELEGHPITTVTVRRVLDQPEYQSVRLATADDEVVLRFPPAWSFGQEKLLPVLAPLTAEQERQQEVALLLFYIREGVLTLSEAAHIIERH